MTAYTMLRKIGNPWAFLMSFVLVAFFPSFVFASTPERTLSSENQVLVTFKNDSKIHVFEVPKGVDTENVARSLRKAPDIAHAEPNGSVRASSMQVMPNDALYSQQSYLPQIQTPSAWSLTTGSPKVTVAILDSGVDITHPDLKSNIYINTGEIPGDGIDNDKNGFIDDVNGWDFINEIPDPNPKFGGSFSDAGIHHGTLLAGIIAGQGNNKIGVAGVTWRSKILPLRVLNNRGEGDILTVIKAIEYSISQKVDVLNLSFVGDTDSLLLKDALRRAYQAGIVVVAASGNDEVNQHGFDLDTKPVFPACYHDSDFWVISVASLNDIGAKASYSNYGRCIDISAPGSNIMTTQVVRYEQPGFDAFYSSGWSGTSLSTAVVSGAVALLKSLDPSITPREMKDLLTQNCDSADALDTTYAGRLGCGKLNVSLAMDKQMKELQRKTAEQQSKELAPPPPMLAIASLNGKMPLRLYSSNGQRDEAKALLPFDPYRISYSLAASSRGATLVAGAGAGSGPQVRIFDTDFTLLGQFFAYDKRFRGGISVAMGDVDGDGVDDIVTVPGVGGGPHVRVFDQEGHLKQQFFAYDRSFRGGLTVAAGDVNGDGKSEIIIAPMKGSGEVKLFSLSGELLTHFSPYPKPISGINVSVGDVDGDGGLEIVTAPAQGNGHVKIFSPVGRLKSSFAPYDSRFKGGLALTVGDLNQDGIDDIVTAPLSGGGPQVRVFASNGKAFSQFFPLPPSYRGGLRISIVP